MVEIGSLKVKTVGTGNERVKVVLFPGHEYPIEHFLPGELQNISPRGPRVWQVRSKRDGAIFFRKTARKSIVGIWTAASEAKLARYLNGLGIQGVHFEEPLAAHVKSGRETHVFYREIKSEREGFTREKFRANQDRLESKVHELGIGLSDYLVNMEGGKDGTLHVYDLEAWYVPPELREKLKLRWGKKLEKFGGKK